MDLINKQLTNTHLNTISDETINSKFCQTFNEIFSYENNNIKVIGTMDKPWFRAKDILKILGYSQNVKTMNNFISQNIPEKYKKPMRDLVEMGGTNESKEIYINEGGLYRLIMRSDKPNAADFQDFVCNELLPNIRKNIILSYEREKQGYMKTINEMKNMLQNLGVKMDHVVHQNEDLQHAMEEKNEDIAILNNNIVKVQEKLNIAVEDRAPLPDKKSKQERFILLKRINKPDFKYYTIRAQHVNAIKAIKRQEELYKDVSILLDLQYHPNSKTLFVRIKEELQNNGVCFRLCEIDIEGTNITEKMLIDSMKTINDEKRDV